MDRKLGALILLLAATPALAGDWEEGTPEELCIMHARTLLTGQPYPSGRIFRTGPTNAQIQEVIAARGVKCEPMELYFEIAKFQLKRRDEAHAANNAIWENYQKQLRMNQQQQQQQQQQQPLLKPPKQTNCRQYGSQIYCTTTGG